MTISAASRAGLAAVLCLFIGAPGIAQEAESQQTGPQPLADATAARFEELLAEIAADKEEIQQLIQRRDESEGIFAEIFAARIDRTGTEMFQDAITLGREVIAQRDKGVDVSAYEAAVTEDLAGLPQAIYGAIDRYSERIEFPTGDQEPQEFVFKDQQLFKVLSEVDAIYKIVSDYVAIADQFGLDAAAEDEFLRTQLAESAANRSIFLEIALDNVAALRSSVATLPNNAPLGEWYAAAQARVQTTAQSMQRIITLMNSLGMETRGYRRQILGVTGEITTDVLDVGIAANLAREWGGAIFELFAEQGPKWIFRLLIFALIIFVFMQIAKLVQKMVRRGLNSARVRVSYLLKDMIINSARNLVILFGILIALSQVGISLGPLLAGLGIAGFIIGFALQDSLSNFASGMLILLYRPFDVGDVVESGGVRGRVTAMSLVNTTFLTLDNQKLVVPNNLIWQSVITNLTAQRKRRVDMIFGISYSDDVEKAQRVLEQILEEDESVLDDPEPVVRVQALGESSVDFAVRPWVKTDDYWETYWGITKKVKMRFDKEGISIPFPQRDVHYFEHKPDPA